METIKKKEKAEGYKGKEAVLRWREKHKEQYKEIKKKVDKRYRENNKEKVNARTKARRDKKKREQKNKDKLIEELKRKVDSQLSLLNTTRTILVNTVAENQKLREERQALISTLESMGYGERTY